MKKIDMFASVQKELQEKPEVTSVDISKKLGIPLVLAEIFQIKLKK